MLNGFLTWLSMVEDKQLGVLAQGLHLSMRLSGRVIPQFPHDPLHHQWEKHRSSLPLTPAVAQAIRP